MKLKVALLFTFIAIGLHVYLTLHYYGLNFGMTGGDSICNLNSTFNCDTVSASPFSSVFGVPIALWGVVTNFILAILILGWWLGWSDDSPRLGRYTLWLSTLMAGTSIIMGLISTFMIGTYCLFCIGVYFLSFGTLILVLKNQEPLARPASKYISDLFGPAKFYWIYILAIPALTFFLHKWYVTNLGASQIDLMVRTSVNEWRSNPVRQIDTVPPSLKKGPDTAKMKIAEFADFRCSHCKHASPGLKAFLSSHSQAQLLFYTFPLDGSCNEAIPSGGDGVSCWLAKNVYCAEKVAQKGWEFHDDIFALQDKMNATRSLDAARPEMEKIVNAYKVPADEQKACVESPETEAAIRAQAKIGSDSGVQGTPALFVNGRKLNRGQILPVLESVYQDIIKKE